jgi:hypothetical protein
MEQCDQRIHVGTSCPFLIWWRSNPRWRNNRVTVRHRSKLVHGGGGGAEEEEAPMTDPKLLPY